MFRSRKLSYSYPLTTGLFNADYADLPLKKLLVNIPVTQTGSGTPSPDNKRNFIGFSGVNIGQTSGYGEYFRGLLNGTYGFVDLGSLNWSQYDAGTEHAFFYSIISNYKYISGNPNAFCDKYDHANISTTNTEEGFSIVSQNIMRFRDLHYPSAADFKTAVTGHYLIYELAEPSTPVTPEQFATLCQAFGITGNTYQITFGQTVYSANLDVLTGKLSITHRYIVLNGSEDWRVLNNGKAGYIELTDAKIINNYCKANCSQYRNTSWTDVSTTDEGNFTLYQNSLWSKARLVFNFAGGTLEAFKTQLSNSNVQVVYELAEPIEIPLGGIDIKTLRGVNNIFADIGTVETQCIKLGS